MYSSKLSFIAACPSRLLFGVDHETVFNSDLGPEFSELGSMQVIPTDLRSKVSPYFPLHCSGGPDGPVVAYRPV
ncbi:Uu.00g126260.m01.CDS01 [Anthostomella pinea]|uniref:Uu.00g126260.m01.CDS01 n=1 Tax=Anthostomella pinea TaxID=933095 RepID=A0AAI8VHY8_9PEZI|nr:Uu.00g126260.m01.CDS01 [Anthostomella pinea]